jgi:hypothetical protein
MNLAPHVVGQLRGLRLLFQCTLTRLLDWWRRSGLREEEVVYGFAARGFQRSGGRLVPFTTDS